MDEFIQDTEEEDFHDDLEPMLEEYRKSKQDKQARLERKAAEDGRPFSAPVESPGCDSIRRRTEGDKALKEHPPGDNRIVYRPSSGSDQLWASDSSGGIAPEAVADADIALITHQAEACLPVVPEEQTAHGQGAEISILPAVHEEALQDDSDLLQTPGESLDAEIQLELAHLCLEDAEGLDTHVSSPPGSIDPASERVDMDEDFEHAGAERVFPSREDSGSHREDTSPRILDQLEEMSIASSQAARKSLTGPAGLSSRPSASAQLPLASAEVLDEDDIQYSGPGSHGLSAVGSHSDVGNNSVSEAKVHPAVNMHLSDARAPSVLEEADHVVDAWNSPEGVAHDEWGEAPAAHEADLQAAQASNATAHVSHDPQSILDVFEEDMVKADESLLVSTQDQTIQHPQALQVAAQQTDESNKIPEIRGHASGDATQSRGSPASALDVLRQKRTEELPSVPLDHLNQLPLITHSHADSAGARGTLQSSHAEAAVAEVKFERSSSTTLLPGMVQHGSKEAPEQALDASDQMRGDSAVPQAASWASIQNSSSQHLGDSGTAVHRSTHESSTGVRRSTIHRAASETRAGNPMREAAVDLQSDREAQTAAAATACVDSAAVADWLDLNVQQIAAHQGRQGQPEIRSAGGAGEQTVRSHPILGADAAVPPFGHLERLDVASPRPEQAARTTAASTHTPRASLGSLDLRQADEAPVNKHIHGPADHSLEPAEGHDQAQHPPVQAMQLYEADDLTNSKVVDRLVAFSVGQMGVEALLQGNVIGAIKFLLEAKQRGVTVVADTLRRAVTLAVGAVSPSSSTSTSVAVQKVLSELIGLVAAGAQQGDLTQLMLEAHMDRTLTEVPKSLGELYQQSRAALQRILHTEAQLLHGVDPTYSSGAPSQSAETGRHGSEAGKHDAEQHANCGLCDSVDGVEIARGASGMPQGPQQGESEMGGQEGVGPALQEVAGSGVGVAACACGRPLLVGTSDGWLRVPTASHSRARRTVSGKNRLHKGRDLPAGIQQHLEEAMQPDGADLEYIYLPGSSRPPSATPRPQPVHEPAEPQASQYHRGSRHEGAMHAPAHLHPVSEGLGELSVSAALPVSRRNSCGPRPATAQPQRRDWDDSLAGAPPRTQPSYESPRAGGRRRPQSAGPAQRAGAPSWSGAGEGGRFWDRQVLCDGWAGQQDHPASLLTGTHRTPYTQEFLSRQVRAEGLGDYFQSPTGSWYPAQAEAPAMDGLWAGGGGAGAGHTRGVGGNVQEMQQVYADQIHEMVRYANQCAAALGLRYRYKAAQRRPASALASRSRMPALEGYVERHIVMADGAGVTNDPGHVSVLTYAKFASVVEGLSIRVNSSRLFAPAVKQKRRKGTRRQKDGLHGSSKNAAYGRR